MAFLMGALDSIVVPMVMLNVMAMGAVAAVAVGTKGARAQLQPRYIGPGVQGQGQDQVTTTPGAGPGTGTPGTGPVATATGPGTGTAPVATGTGAPGTGAPLIGTTLMGTADFAKHVEYAKAHWGDFVISIVTPLHVAGAMMKPELARVYRELIDSADSGYVDALMNWIMNRVARVALDPADAGLTLADYFVKKTEGSDWDVVYLPVEFNADGGLKEFGIHGKKELYDFVHEYNDHLYYKYCEDMKVVFQHDFIKGILNMGGAKSVSTRPGRFDVNVSFFFDHYMRGEVMNPTAAAAYPPYHFRPVTVAATPAVAPPGGAPAAPAASAVAPVGAPVAPAAAPAVTPAVTPVGAPAATGAVGALDWNGLPPPAAPTDLNAKGTVVLTMRHIAALDEMTDDVSIRGVAVAAEALLNTVNMLRNNSSLHEFQLHPPYSTSNDLKLVKKAGGIINLVVGADLLININILSQRDAEDVVNSIPVPAAVATLTIEEAYGELAEYIEDIVDTIHNGRHTHPPTEDLLKFNGAGLFEQVMKYLGDNTLRINDYLTVDSLLRLKGRIQNIAFAASTPK